MVFRQDGTKCKTVVEAEGRTGYLSGKGGSEKTDFRKQVFSPFLSFNTTGNVAGTHPVENEKPIQMHKHRNQENAVMEEAAKDQAGLLKEASREIYENITQCLCLARLQLGNIDLGDKEKSLQVIGEANLLIGKAVKDLRNLAKQLAPVKK